MTATKPFRQGATEPKMAARSATLISAIRASGITDYDVISLCSRQTTDPLSEINQLLAEGLIASKANYFGVDQNMRDVYQNEKDHPEATFSWGKVSEVLQHKISRADGKRAVLYLDFMGLKDIFYKGPLHEPFGGQRSVPGSARRTSIDVRGNVARKMAQDPGELPLALATCLDDDVVVVNVQTEGRGQGWDFTGDLIGYLIPNLDGWKVTPLMNGTDSFYTYRSKTLVNGVPGRGRPSNYTSFALTKKNPNPGLTPTRKAAKVTNMNNPTKPIPQPTTKKAQDAERKLAIYALIVAGVSDVTIASMAGVSLRTVAAHRAHVTMGNSPVQLT